MSTKIIQACALGVALFANAAWVAAQQQVPPGMRITIVGESSNTQIVPPLFVDPSLLSYTIQVHGFQSFYDRNANGIVDNDTRLPERPSTSGIPEAYPLYYEAFQPIPSHLHSWILRNTNRYRTQNGTTANIVVVGGFSPTDGAWGNEQYIAMHFRYDAQRNQLQILDVRGGDYQSPSGRIMLSLSNTLRQSAVQLPGVGVAGQIQARLTANLEFRQVQSDLVVGVQTSILRTDVEIEFNLPLGCDTEPLPTVYPGGRWVPSWFPILREFGPQAGGWDLPNNPRMMVDVDGDGRADIVGFADNGVYVSLSTSISCSSSFTGPVRVLSAYGIATSRLQPAQYLRTMADVNGDGKADIVAFDYDGVYVSLSTGTPGQARFLPRSSQPALRGFALGAGGWTVENHPRMLADVNGDGKADIVGFGYAGVYVALSTSTPTQVSFIPPSQPAIRTYGLGAGGWSTQNHLRMMADVDGDRKADIVGFGATNVYVSLSTSTPTQASFGGAQPVLQQFTIGSGGWQVNRDVRTLADVDGDGKADIVGFCTSGAYVALSRTTLRGTPQFGAMTRVPRAYDYRTGPYAQRMAADVSGDGKADLIYIASGSAFVFLSNSPIGTVQFTGGQGWVGGSASASRWDDPQHFFALADINGDHRGDLVGFGWDGVYAARSNGVDRFVRN